MARLRFAPIPFVIALVWACSSKEATSSSPAPGDGGTATDGGRAADGSGSGGSASVCAATRAYVVRCAGESELDCGASKFDAWCADKDQKTNSEAFRRAETKCLPDVACDADARRDCVYKTYAAEEQTDAQKALAEAYCSTCEPEDTAGCLTRSTTYDPAAGPDAVTDIFIAAWELADPIVEQIREKCTGAALPAGADPCPKRFGSCAADPYLDGLPDCPP